MISARSAPKVAPTIVCKNCLGSEMRGKSCLVSRCLRKSAGATPTVLLFQPRIPAELSYYTELYMQTIIDDYKAPRRARYSLIARAMNQA